MHSSVPGGNGSPGAASGVRREFPRPPGSCSGPSRPIPAISPHRRTGATGCRRPEHFDRRDQHGRIDDTASARTLTGIKDHLPRILLRGQGQSAAPISTPQARRCGERIQILRRQRKKGRPLPLQLLCQGRQRLRCPSPPAATHQSEEVTGQGHVSRCNPFGLGSF
jgi:hypothetical protein